jgi:hypothetical protein
MNTEKVSDTPRTDAEQEHVNNAFNDQICTVPAPDPYFVPVGFARQLERELRDWQRLQLWGGTPAVVEAFIKGQQNRIHTCQDLELELAEWKAMSKRLAKELRGWIGSEFKRSVVNEDPAIKAFNKLLKSSP